MRRFTVLCSAAALAAVAISAPSAVGARKPSTNDSVLLLRVVSGPDLVASWSDQVTFDVGTSATSEPHVDLTCTQNGVSVYGATTGFYDSYPWPWTQVMNLASQDWSAGGADCTARLYYFNGKRQATLKTITFRAEA
jgi:hypothetical protein